MRKWPRDLGELRRRALMQSLMPHLGEELDLGSLANLTLSDLHAAVEVSVAAGEPLPEDLEGTTEQDKSSTYARSFLQAIEGAFPTRFAAKALAQAPTIDAALVNEVLKANPGLDVRNALSADFDLSTVPANRLQDARSALAALGDESRLFPALDVNAALTGGVFVNFLREAVHQFLQRAPDFDLVSTDVGLYISENQSKVFEGVEPATQAAVKNQLRTMQRIYQVAPKQEHATALLSRGFTSAASVVGYGQAAFVKDFSGVLGGNENAARVASAAARVTTVAMNLLALAYDERRSVLPRSVSMRADAVQNASGASYDNLFGPQDYCECIDCRSVYSPAAYFVDLMEFLRRKNSRPLTCLNQRRPDLQDIPLTCDNTNKPLPYIDLVIEVLESYIAHEQPTANTTSAGATAESLAARREYSSIFPKGISEKAHASLTQAVFPPSLDFHGSICRGLNAAEMVRKCPLGIRGVSIIGY